MDIPPDPRPEPPGPPHLADPRALQILSTEHWSLLTARSLVYNEFFSRGSMFLTLLSASLVALGFVYQGSGGGPDFPLIVAAVLALDLFVGLATLGRLIDATMEEFRSLQAMGRIRHAYLEMVPTLAPYFSTSTHDDAASILDPYLDQPGASGPLQFLAAGLTTMPGMIMVLNATITGALVASVAIAMFGDGRVAIVAALVAAVVSFAAFSAWGLRTFRDISPRFTARFPGPDTVAGHADRRST